MLLTIFGIEGRIRFLKNEHSRIKVGFPNRTSIVVQNAKFDSTVVGTNNFKIYTIFFLIGILKQ